MELINKNNFFALTENFEIVPYTQTEAWVDANSRNNTSKLLFLIDDVNNPQIGCIGHIKKFMGLKMLLIEGECIRHTIKSSCIKNFYNEITKIGYQIIELNCNRPYEYEYEIGIRQAGYLRPVGLFSLQQTSYINLQNDIKYNSNWKRNLKNSTENELVFENITHPTVSDIKDFLSLYSEMCDLKGISQSFNFEFINTLVNSSNFQLFFVKKGNIRLSTILIHKCKEHAGLLYAATGKKAYNYSASFFMYDKLFSNLSDSGYKSFDMEKLAPSTHSTNSVFIFKNGIKGNYLLINGEWSWYKKTYYRPLMYFVKKYLMKKREI